VYGLVVKEESSSSKINETLSQGGYYVSHESLHAMDTTSFDQNDNVTGNTSTNVTPAGYSLGNAISDQLWAKHGSGKGMAAIHTSGPPLGNNGYTYKNGKL